MTSKWLVPTGLIVLSFVPVIAGGSRLAQLANGGPVTADSARFFADPVPVVAHIVGASTFAILGALQFSAPFRRGHPRWHRVAGRVVVPAGLAVALSGMYMAVWYPHPANVGTVLTGFRLVFGTAMAASIVLGFLAIRRRDVRAHRAWMIRGYAIGLGAGTQVFTQSGLILATGPLTMSGNTYSMLAGWLINIAV
ncbi:MAG TPA: DUF2306 domain-containing protein, partial [Pseudonocardiaceae bacterium]|nr:DUF2306 domain-containing protein [Pseudonocardiaceae bacterium]